MALEFISYENIVREEKIPIPKNANCRKADCFRKKSGEIRFFISNPAISDEMKRIPEHAEEISFDEYEKHAYNIFYGDPTFYDSQGNII